MAPAVIVPNPGDLALAGGSALLAVQSAYSAAISLYAWEHESRHTGSRAPESREPPTVSFTILLPARHEEAVIADTIERMVELNYPSELVQILVVMESGDTGTIAAVTTKLTELVARGIRHVRMLTFDEPPINKPHGLNVGLAVADRDVVTIFDAEDEPHPDILDIVNTIMVREGAQVVQCGVQLMNYDEHWFSALNVVEYFFWFKSRLHYHGTRGAVPLGGNTAFMRRGLLEGLGGWDEHCLTEDADIGIRLSAAGVQMRLVYDDAHVTREETPHTVGDFVRQRTRWDQGFLQVLRKGDWRRLPTHGQRRLAVYTLAFPVFQALMMLYLPLSAWLIVAHRAPVLVAMVAALPLYMVAIQYLITVAALSEFVEAHGLRRQHLMWLRVALVFYPFQCLLSYAALRAVWRQARRVNTWEKTTHTGAHRQPSLVVATPRPVESYPVEAFPGDEYLEGERYPGDPYGPYAPDPYVPDPYAPGPADVPS